jgi:hypothetical protein
MKIYNFVKKIYIQFSQAALVKTGINCDFLYWPRKQLTVFGGQAPVAYKNFTPSTKITRVTGLSPSGGGNCGRLHGTA